LCFNKSIIRFIRNTESNILDCIVTFVALDCFFHVVASDTYMYYIYCYLFLIMMVINACHLMVSFILGIEKALQLNLSRSITKAHDQPHQVIEMKEIR